MKIKEELANNSSILIYAPDAGYKELIIDVAKKLSSHNICYITTNKTYSALIEIFKKSGVNLNNIIFIDTISKSIKKDPEESDHVYYINSTAAMTELSIVLNKFLAHKFDYLIFDSLSNLLIYQNKHLVIKFVSSIINKIKESNTKAVFYVMKIQEHESFIKECGMFVDKVIE